MRAPSPPEAAAAGGDPGRRVLFAAPTAKDESVTAAVLGAARIAHVACGNLYQLGSEIDAGVGAILLTGEALTAQGIQDLIASLERQPAWSEPPIVLLMSGSAQGPARVLSALGNVTLLERPAPIRSVLSAVQSALRGRERQYQIRDQIAAISHAEHSARELQQQLELAIDASELGTFHCTLPLGRTRLNERCKALFGLPPEAEVDFETIYDRLHPDDRAATRAAVDVCVFGGEPFDMEFRVVSPGSQTRWIRATGRTYRDVHGDPVRFDGTMQDISRKKETEEALRMADRRKDEFLAMLAHELRNPLAPIRNAVQILRIRAPDDAHLRSTGDMIARQVRHLARLVDDLLDVSRVTQGKVMLRKQPIDLTRVILDGIELAQPFIEAKGHRLTIDLGAVAGLEVEGDGTRIAQVIGNLLDNAAKYTDDNGRISVVATREGGRAAIRVADNGMGIARELLPRIFDLFTQAERSLDRSQGGLGIGLSLVKTLVALHGGSVEARSAGPGHGSEFTVRLPVIAGAATGGRDAGGGERADFAESGERTGTAEPAGRHRRVLIVEDNIDSADSLRTLLELDGHDVRCAHDGMAALGIAATFQPDVALLDLGLPVMTGFELARHLRARPETRDVLLVALTGYGQAEDRKRTEEAGFDHHLVKPVDPARLADLVATAPSRAGDPPSQTA